MTHRHKIKGAYHEKRVVEFLESLGIPAERVPLSGSLGGKYTGDIHANILGHKLVVEVKYRTSSRLPNAFSVLEDRDLAFLRRKAGRSTEQVVVMSESTFRKLMKEQQHGIHHPEIDQ